MITAERFHDFSAGHRVAGHENKCASLHGHNYRIHFRVQSRTLDMLGRVLDFSGIKVLADWLEENWDHKFLYWEEDSVIQRIVEQTAGRWLDENRTNKSQSAVDDLARAGNGFVALGFNPTAEHMARHLGQVVAPQLLPEDVRCIWVKVEETRKCSATWEI